LRFTSQIVAAELKTAVAAVVDILIFDIVLFRSGNRSIIAVVLKKIINSAIRSFYFVIISKLRTI